MIPAIVDWQVQYRMLSLTGEKGLPEVSISQSLICILEGWVDTPFLELGRCETPICHHQEDQDCFFFFFFFLNLRYLYSGSQHKSKKKKKSRIIWLNKDKKNYLT